VIRETVIDRHARYVLRHADDNLVLAQRLSEWVSRAPELEEDIALANTALDHLGVATHLLGHAADLVGGGRSDDDLAFGRTEREFSNAVLVEQPNGDFARTMARQLLFDAYQVGLWDALSGSADAVLAGIAEKAAKETAYHFRHSSAWVIRLGDGTEESGRRMQRGLEGMWRFTGELFEMDDVDREMVAAGIGADVAAQQAAWLARVSAVLDEAGLDVPSPGAQRGGGRSGRHGEDLGHLLAEMQWMQRTYPGLEW
jgi:ring-1,2-phenylacetyl-CoA epoxidase subunit PaaC